MTLGAAQNGAKLALFARHTMGIVYFIFHPTAGERALMVKKVMNGAQAYRATFSSTEAVDQAGQSRFAQAVCRPFAKQTSEAFHLSVIRFIASCIIGARL